jgi:hypothetical protein
MILYKAIANFVIIFYYYQYIFGLDKAILECTKDCDNNMSC